MYLQDRETHFGDFWSFEGRYESKESHLCCQIFPSSFSQLHKEKTYIFNNFAYKLVVLGSLSKICWFYQWFDGWNFILISYRKIPESFPLMIRESSILNTARYQMNNAWIKTLTRIYCWTKVETKDNKILRSFLRVRSGVTSKYILKSC